MSEAAGFEWGLFSEKSLRSIATSTARINLWHGAVRSGKTVSSQVRWLKFIQEAPRGGHLLMVGVTIGTLKDNILDPISEMVGPENYHFSSGSREVYICGRRILIRGASDESSEKKIRGLTLAGVYGDEVTLWPQNFFKRSLDRMSVRGAKGFFTTNPDSPYHWLKTDYIDRERELNMRSYHFELTDNPNLPQEYVEDLKKEFTGLWYKRFIQGLWVVAEGAIYDGFDEDLHVVDEVPHPSQYERIIAGVDYGTYNPTSFLSLGLYKGTWYVFSECRYEGGAGGIQRQRTDAEHSQAMREWIENGGWTPDSIQIDPSAASFKQQLKQDGLTTIKNADHDVLDGIRVVARALSRGQLKVHRSCTHLIKEFATYVWDPKAQEERGEDKPIKQNDHSLDSLRYAAMKAIGKSKKEVVKKPRGA
jgi:PBSX family phage terminase large subunit